MADAKIGEFEYKTAKWDAFQQSNVARRLAPCLAETIKVTIEGGETIDQVITLTKAMARMTDEEYNYMTKAALRVTQRKDPTSGLWVAVVAAGDRIMFADITWREVQEITRVVIGDNLGDFTDALRPITANLVGA